MRHQDLQSRSLLTLDQHRSTLIQVSRGMVWLTEAGEDIILRTGDRYRVMSDDRILIEALEASSLQLERRGSMLRPVLRKLFARLAKWRERRAGGGACIPEGR